MLFFVNSPFAGSDVPLIRICFKKIPQISIQVLYRNVLIAGECCTHRSEYFSITLLYRDLLTQHFRGLEGLFHPQIKKRSSVAINISKTSASVSSGFQTRETFETTRSQAEWFYCFLALVKLMKLLLLQQRKLV